MGQRPAYAGALLGGGTVVAAATRNDASRCSNACDSDPQKAAMNWR